MGFENYFLIFVFMVVSNIVCASSALIIWRKNVVLNDKYDNALKMLCDEEDLCSSNAAIIKKLTEQLVQRDCVINSFTYSFRASENRCNELGIQLEESESKFVGLQKSFEIMNAQRKSQCEIVNRVHMLCNKVESEKGLMGWISVDIIRGCLNGSFKNVV